MTEAVKPARLSAPEVLYSSMSTEFDAAPDMGRTVRNGTISAGMPTRDVIGDKIEVSTSAAPEAVNKDAAVHISTSPGSSFTVVSRPLSAPLIKLENRSFFESNSNSAHTRRSAGTAAAVIFSIGIFYSITV